MESTQYVHFIGICGAGMSAVAKLLRDTGWHVSGSDASFYPPVSTFLEQENLPCATPYHPNNIPPTASLVVIGKHAKLTPEQNEEVRHAFARAQEGSLRVVSYPEVLETLTQQTENIVVVGSYGKSTTTALLAWVLHHAGADPTYFIGAIPLDFRASSHKGGGRYFVLEGDEYPSANWDSRPKFSYYNAKTVVLTSCEHDHFNEFPTLESYLEPYRILLRSLKPDSLLVACLDGKEVEGILPETSARIVTYSGENRSDADWFVSHVETSTEGMRFTVAHRDRSTNGILEEIEVTTRLLGAHNRQNIVGCVATLLEQNALTGEQIQRALADFKGLRRRLEVKSNRGLVTIYEDLSSSRPKAVAALQAVLARHASAKVHVIFQPHTFSFRSRQALEWYPAMFEGAEQVLVFSPPNLRGQSSTELLSHEEIAESIRMGNICPMVMVGSAEEILSVLVPRLQAEDVVLFMTSGGMEGSIAPVIEAIEQAFPRP
jgi:UDP-N-acetylmuramate: L-alanyl-gamma-D-glutamyl-meso-diaminopimelate ligase